MSSKIEIFTRKLGTIFPTWYSTRIDSIFSRGSRRTRPSLLVCQTEPPPLPLHCSSEKCLKASWPSVRVLFWGTLTLSVKLKNSSKHQLASNGGMKLWWLSILHRGQSLSGIYFKYWRPKLTSSSSKRAIILGLFKQHKFFQTSWITFQLTGLFCGFYSI